MRFQLMGPDTVKPGYEFLGINEDVVWEYASKMKDIEEAKTAAISHGKITRVERHAFYWIDAKRPERGEVETFFPFNKRASAHYPDIRPAIDPPGIIIPSEPENRDLRLVSSLFLEGLIDEQASGTRGVSIALVPVGQE